MPSHFPVKPIIDMARNASITREPDVAEGRRRTAARLGFDVSLWDLGKAALKATAPVPCAEPYAPPCPF